MKRINILCRGGSTEAEFIRVINNELERVTLAMTAEHWSHVERVTPFADAYGTVQSVFIESDVDDAVEN